MRFLAISSKDKKLKICSKHKSGRLNKCTILSFGLPWKIVCFVFPFFLINNCLLPLQNTRIFTRNCGQ